MIRHLTVDRPRNRRPARPFARLIGALGLLLALSAGAAAQEAFQTPEAAVEALVTAAKAADARALLRVLGADGQDIVSSGDPVDDANTRKRFIEAYDAKHQITKEGDDKAILELGADDWPFPIPVVRREGAWRFDTAAGREELLFRRIGRNELNVIQAALAYVDAQQEYAEKGYGGAGLAAYAQRIVSQPGKKDGLYWPAAAGEPESPLGEFAAKAAFDGYRPGQQSIPFHGYYYKILTRQGPSAPGGAIDYIVKGNMIGGFALVAYPAAYENSGIMTFMVNQDGVIYQKDLGPNTARIAGSITAFNPDEGWEKVVNDGVPQTSAKP
jgi:Protein of unknown function (DUF2950)